MEHNKNYNIETSCSSTTSSVDSHDEFRIRIESFHARENSVSKNESAEKKLSWLRSQIVGENVDFETPFGKRRLTYADHTASGRCLHYIENYIINNVLPFYGNSHTSDSYVGYQTTKLVHEAAAYVKKCLGGGEEDAIIFCGSGSTAAIKRLQEIMGISVPSILREKVLSKCFHNETKERWVVFVGPYEHHSNILSWRQSLAEVVEIGLEENGLVDMEALRVQLEFYKSKNRPLLGSFSACSNVTGTYSDTRAIACLLHKNGAFACFDFAASAPYTKIDMRSGDIDGYDAVFLSPHKFLGGPGTPGILVMNKTLYRLRNSPPSTCGGGTVDFVNPFNEKDTLYMENIEEREDAGTPPIIQKARGGCACAGPYGHSLLKVDEPHSLAFRDAIQMGYSGVKPGWTRVSFPYYMSKEEFVFIVAAIEFISIYGQRFLPLYHFNWRNGTWTFKKKLFNCNFCCSQMMKALNMGCHDTKENNHGGGSITKEGLVYKYVKYLEIAKRVASLLPKFPPKRMIPDEIDPDLVPFRI
ncbi:probable cysteine desulfurase isoform X2 [Capsicum annuum]|uniref:probable cysteine desulfurase isoform X2 n=1 Tax=Capsicum annuum TaxID=4072 RepID=UPI001FB14E95|nr:probable cysteine desulfurase isoform X2 [Capsicum annuum]